MIHNDPPVNQLLINATNTIPAFMVLKDCTDIAHQVLIS